MPPDTSSLSRQFGQGKQDSSLAREARLSSVPDQSARTAIAVAERDGKIDHSTAAEMLSDLKSQGK